MQSKRKKNIIFFLWILLISRCTLERLTERHVCVFL